MARYSLYLFLFIITIPNIVYAQTNSIDHHQLQKLIHTTDTTKASKALVIHNSEVIGSFNSNNCDKTYMGTASMVKSWTGLAVGILVKKGFIKSENEQICNYVPEWKSGCENNITIKQLLTMSSGLQRIRPASESILAQDDMDSFALNQDVTKEPGKDFSYSNEGVQLLGILIENASGLSASDFFQDYLFKPLEMDSTSLMVDESGNDIVYGGAQTTIQDASKIALLMLNEGSYKGKQIVPPQWVGKSTTPSQTHESYGYLWWINTEHYGSQMENYSAMGDFGQLTIIFPKKNLIYLREQACNKKPGTNMKWMGQDFINIIGKVIIRN
ncbi:Beta-lactamase [Fodinibius salinus]|uniref:Beta-lactamase n=1 Tax=Fodinibius salinus TaxID=860790 RepID=A0A5D3YLV6_9BACT|nr:serine hydrolase [Fodinibius salinus]TYP94752.1 Beta-lactamase [Fodinibius salinus]